MSRPDGRIEPGQPLGSAISARAWNRAQDAADIVLGATPGVTRPRPDSFPTVAPRVIVTMNKLRAEAMHIGQSVEFFLNENNATGLPPYFRDMALAANWPPNDETFADTVDARSTDIATAKYLSHLGKLLPVYSCELIRPITTFAQNFEAVELMPNVGVVVAESPQEDNSVSVCIAGPVLAYVRYQFSWQTFANACAIRPFDLDDIPIEESIGLLEVHRGGGIRILHSREQRSVSGGFPNVYLNVVVL